MADPGTLEVVEEVRISPVKANLLGIALLAPLGFVYVGIAVYLPHRHESLWMTVTMVVAMILMIVAHEGLHGYAAWRYGRTAIRNMRFGADWKAGVFYFHTPNPMTVENYLRVTLMPLIILGPIATALVFILPSVPTGMLAAVTVGACAGDLMACRQLRRFVGQGLHVVDHPTECGFDVGRLSDPADFSAGSSADHGSGGK